MGKFGKGKGKALRHSNKPSQKRRHPSRTKRFCYQKGIAIATSKVHYLIPMILEAALQEMMRCSILYTHKKSTVQSRDVKAGIKGFRNKIVI